ncbi:MAG TPA: SDR family NAD(P)-dependent oxidoreductase [Micromonosporaceae bacterium]|nr:SDR family NAD(P)-dependent oxidoreductase [Micromonosporaceae bacterium]
MQQIGEDQMRSGSGDSNRLNGRRTPDAEIAIVGVGCRFPGGVRNLDAFGRLLTSGADVLRDVPGDRWGRDRYNPTGGPGTISNHRGAFLDDIDRFDAGYFGVSPREANVLDPQHRLILEVAWEAMADSGRPRNEWCGTRTSVTFGMLANDYGLLHARALGVDEIGEHHVGGLEFSFAAGRLAYAFDLHGPVSTVNSACSSSLLAVHQACQSLRTGDADTAIAGGVSLLITPDISVFLSRVGAISKSGRCRPFDAAADGIVRGEGCGVVVLKRLRDAVADGDRVYAVIRGSAANNDGRSMGLTVPNSVAQADLLRAALSRAGLEPGEVDYVEAHGTGTAIGDLMELDALGEVYGAGRTAHSPILVGSHKAVLGHMDAAAGIGGLLKSVWIARSGVIPRQPHVDRLNPSVNWRSGALGVPLAETRLEGLDRPARAGVSAFGLSGTNVHVIVEAFAADEAPAVPAAPPHVLVASGLDDAALAEQVAGLRDRVAADEDGLADLLASAATRRTHENHRYAVVAADREELLAGLADPARAYAGVVEDPDSSPPPIFVYAEHSGPRSGAVIDLYDADQGFRGALDECATLIAREHSWSLLDELRRPAGTIGPDRVGIDRTATIAVQVALTRWLAYRGVRPGAVLGLGAGEFVAGHLTGSLSLADAIRKAARRAGAPDLAEIGRFEATIDALVAEDDHPLVEIGVAQLGAVLTDAARRHNRHAPVLAMLHPDEPASMTAHRGLAQLHVAGVPVDWGRVTGRPRRYRSLPTPSWREGRYWLPGVPRGEQRPGGAVPASGEAPPPGAGTSAPTSRPAATLIGQVTSAVRQVLGLPDSQPVARRRGLFEQGLDSLTAVALRQRLERQFGVSLPVPIVFERPSVATLAEYLAEIGADASAPAETVADREPIAPVAPVPSSGAPVPPSQAPVGAAEPIAVVGVACRLPGASSPGEFWDLLLSSTETAREAPARRRDDPMWAELGSQIPSRGSYLDDVAGFDAPFFRVSPREARLLDPQQRLFLEVAWEALEDAGCPADTLAGRPVGVYAGLAMADYQHLVAREITRDARGLSLHHGTGTSFAALAGRLSYVLGLHGPSLAVDTACSASLTAVHLACQALRSGDCEMAVVGGASTIVAPSPLMASMGASGALSLDGRCKAFDEDADGFGCGEGAAVLVLKPLSAARRDGDRVYAVLAGSAVNQDGASGGLTVPNAAAQVAVVRQALRRAGWSPSDVDYVETHGTGTPLGDPIEARALAESLGGGRANDRPLLIGSAKANVGHLGAAAGVVGLLKVVLAMAHRRLPPHVVQEPTSRIDWDNLPVALVTKAQDWPSRSGPARAGVSAFGFSGSNAHVLVEQAPGLPAGEPAPAGPPYVLPVSAATPEALRAAAGRLADHLRTSPESVDDIVFTATHRRSMLDHRLAVTGVDRDALIEALAAFAAGEQPAGAHTGRPSDADPPAVVLSYGEQLPPVASLRRWSAPGSRYERTLATLAGELSRIAGRDCNPWAAPAAGLAGAYLFCHQAAATDAWAGLGVVPVAVTGAGPGRVTAAWAAGQMTAAEALRLLAEGAGTPPPYRAGRVPVLPSGDTPDQLVDVLVPETVAAIVVAGYRPAGRDTAARVVSLPAYPWEHRPYWYRDLSPRPVLSWALSAGDADELRDRVARLTGFVRDGEVNSAAVANALAAEPCAAHRLVVTGADRAQLLAALDEHCVGERPGNLVQRVAVAPNRTVFVFPGQGWQWTGMGVRLLEVSPVFASTVEECSALVQELTGWSVLDVLRGAPGAPSMDRVDVVQPVMFTVMVALAGWWQSIGVQPDAVVGHSQGEIAAACVAGILALPDAVRVVVARAAALTRLAGQGAMISVAAGAEAVQVRLAGGFGGLAVAAYNGPNSTVLSGAADAAETFLAACAADGIRVRRIPVDYASHGPQIDTIREHLLDKLGAVTPGPARVPLYSTVTGTVLDPWQMTTDYWFENLRRPVRFETAVRALLGDGFTTFLECSAHPVLGVGISDTVADVGADATVLDTLRRDDDTASRLHIAAAHAWTGGLSVDWATLLPAVATAQLPWGRTVAASPAPTAPGGLVERRFWQSIERGDTERLAETLNLHGDQRAALGELLPGLSTWWRQMREESVTESWRYRTGWQPVDAVPTEQTGSWLVVAPATQATHPLVTSCAEALEAEVLTVNPAAADLGGLLSAAVARSGAPARVLSLLGLDDTLLPDHAAVSAGLAGTVRLVQALDDMGIDAQLWSATTGAVSTRPEEAPSPVQALLWGLSRVVRLEHPDRGAGLVDLPPVLDSAARARLRAALTAAGREDQLAVRADGIYAPRLQRAPVPSTAPAQRWKPRGTTLVTGGTGALGGHIARWLAHKGAPHLLLLSRRGPEAAGAAHLRAELVELGAQVTIIACDVADRGDLARVLAAVPAEHPLTAVVHTAGVVGDRPLRDLTAARLDEVLRPKTTAVRNLDELTRGHDLTAFVLFSSWSALLPNVGQAGYAAGNAYLDAVAARRRAAGLPALSVAWGAWSGGGMAGGEGFAQWLSRGGMDLMTPHLAVTALHQALDHGDTAVAVANVDWQRFAEISRAGGPQPLVAELLPGVGAIAGAAPPAQPLEHLAGLSAAQREEALLDVVCADVAVVLGHATGQRTDPDQTFRDLGFDSVTAIELKNRLVASTGLRVSPTAIFDHPNPVALARHLAETYDAQAPQTRVDEPAAAAEDNWDEIDGMAVEDLVRLARGNAS